VHVDVRGLQPGRTYYYRFRCGHEISATGRTRTAPAEGAHVSQLRLAIASCQNYTTGFYTAYAHLAEEDLDAVVFLGDYIYEGGRTGSLGRAHAPARTLSSLSDFRIRYAQYRTDPNLQEAHRVLPWIVTVD